MAAYYISPTGNDTTGDGSLGNPWATISKAHTAGSSGDTIICLDGTYTWANQTFTKSLVIQAATVGAAIFDGAAGAIVWTFGSGVTVSHDGLRFTNASYPSGNSVFKDVGSAGVSCTFSFENCIFDNITLYNNSGDYNGLFGRGGTNPTTVTLTVQNCLFQDIKKYVSASYTYIWQYRGVAAGSVITFTNNTFCFTDTGTAQPNRFCDAVSTTLTATLTNNIIYNGTGGTFTFNSSALTTLTANNNDFYLITSAPAGTGNITDDPLFVDTANDNFNLRPTSPCIDTGALP